MFVRIITCLFIGTFLLSSCKSKKAVANRKKAKTERVIVATTPNIVKEDKQESATTAPVKPTGSYAETVTSYINEYGKIAQEEMLQYGIPASITIAQGILESGAGRGELTNKANNHFGIKCHKGWTGERVYHDDDAAQECFRKYKDPKYSFRDHSLFLTERSRYQDLFKLKKDDYKGWAKGLKKAGYATDPRYPNKLISIIERYNLAELDREVLGSKVVALASTDSKINRYEVVQGDTLYSIARRFNLTVDTLKEYNGLTSNDISVGQELYLHAIKNQN